MNIKLGIAPINWSNDDDHNLGAHISLDQCLGEMQRAGYRGTEMGHKFPRDVHALRAILDRYGLCLTTDWIGTRFTEGDDAFARTIDSFHETVEFLRQLDVTALKVCECGHSVQGTLAPIFHERVEFSEPQWSSLRKGLHHIAEIAARADMFIAYHPHLGTGVQSQAQIDRLMEETDPSGVSLLPDTGHILCAGTDPVDVIDRYIDRIRYVHLKDVRATVRAHAADARLSFMDAVRAGLFTVPGDGCIDFRPILARLQAAHYGGWLIVEAEQDPAQAPPYLYAQSAMSYLRRCLERLSC